MKKVEAELTAYIKYKCPHCETEDDMFLEASELLDIDPENADIKVECPFCEEEFIISEIID